MSSPAPMAQERRHLRANSFRTKPEAKTFSMLISSLPGYRRPLLGLWNCGPLVSWLQRWHELSVTGASFSFETTMSGRTYAVMLQSLKEQGYRIGISFLWLKNTDLSLRRIRQRVRKGGHNVPVEAVRRRRLPGIRNFFNLYLPLADEAMLFDASGVSPILVSRFTASSVNPNSTKGSMKKAGNKSMSPYATAALKALRRARKAAERENARFGLPMIFWKDGRIVSVPSRKSV